MKKTKSKKRIQAAEPKRDKNGFRKRSIQEFLKPLKHPKPLPGFVPTLPGPPGWKVKLDPGA